MTEINFVKRNGSHQVGSFATCRGVWPGDIGSPESCSRLAGRFQIFRAEPSHRTLSICLAHHNCARLMSTRRVPSRSVSAESSEKSMSSSPWRERRLTVEHPRVQLVLTALSCSSHARFEVLLFQQLPPYSKRQ